MRNFLNRWFVQSLSHIQLFVTPWTAAHWASLSFTISQSLLKLTSIESMMPSNHLILCCPLLLLRSIFPSIRVFSKELALCIRWPTFWNFSFSISPSNEYLGLVSFRIRLGLISFRISFRIDLLVVQGTLKSLLQYQSSKAPILSRSLLYGPTFTSTHEYWQKPYLWLYPDGIEPVCSAGEPGSIPGSGRSLGEGNGNPLQYYYLENAADGGAW